MKTTSSSGTQICGYPVRMEKTIKVSMDDIQEYFTNETVAFTYLQKVGDEIGLYQKLGIWELMNSADRR